MRTIPKLFRAGQILLISLLTGCAGSTADNKGLDYDQLDVNFEAVVQGEALTTDDVVAVFATCTRGEETDLNMSQNKPAHFVPVLSGTTVNLIRRSEQDNILAYAGDHNFKFSAFLPLSAYDGDVTSLNASVPSVVEYGKTARALQVAKAAKTSVVAPVELNFQSIAAHMVINVPGNILGNDVLPVLKSLEIEPYDPAEFSGMLAFDATYDLSNNQLNVVDGSSNRYAYRIRLFKTLGAFRCHY